MSQRHTEMRGNNHSEWIIQTKNDLPDESIFFISVMVQYHGLGLLYQIRKLDLGILKLVATLRKMHLKSPYAVCMLVLSWI